MQKGAPMLMGSAVARRPIFIVGAARSGTTLLQRMIGSHPNISAPTGESHFMVPLGRTERQWGNLRDPRCVARVLERMQEISPEFTDEDLQGLTFDPPKLAPLLAKRVDGTMVGLIRALFEHNAHGQGKQRWADKTPYYVLHMEMILEMFPDTQFVHIIRDGRDCAISMLGRRHELRIYSVYHAAQTWAQYVNAGQINGNRLRADQYHELHYEDLITDPERVLRALCHYLDEPFDARMVNFRRSSDVGNRTPLLRQSLQPANREKWRGSLSTWQIRVFESEAGATLARNGYPLSTRIGRLPVPVRAAFRAHTQISNWMSRHWINPPRRHSG
jgi:hypothetical protein